MHNIKTIYNINIIMKSKIISIPAIKQDIAFIIGQNATENDHLIERSNDDDIWFHVDNKSSCHVVATISENNITRKNMKYIIKQGALLCKTHSYPSEKNLSIVYTKIKNIQSTNIPGQVTLLSPPSVISI